MNNNFVFQFHNGSIKRFFKSTRYIQKNWFQFHNGSIKSWRNDSSASNQTWFQFHNGSIKRREGAIGYE